MNGNELRRRRLALGLRQSDLAKEAGVSTQTISTRESAETPRRPRVDISKTIENALQRLEAQKAAA